MNIQKPIRQELLEFCLLLGHINPFQFKSICQFVQITPQPNYESWVPNLMPILQKTQDEQINRVHELTKNVEEEISTTQEAQILASECGVPTKDVDNFIGSFILLMSLLQLQRLLKSFSVLQLMKLFEIIPPGPPVQQLQLLQYLQQLFGQLKADVLPSIQKELEKVTPGTEQQTLIAMLNLPPNFFQLYQPIRLLLQLETDELCKLQELLPKLEPSQMLQLLQLLQLQPFDVLELRNLLHPSEPLFQQQQQQQQQVYSPIPTISQTVPMDEQPTQSRRGEANIQIVQQPPEKSVYKRNLKPNPEVIIVGDKANDGNLYVVANLVRCDTLTEETKFLTGNRPVRVAPGKAITFKKLKITTTSHQQQETLFCVKFELRKYTGEDEFTVIDNVFSSPICVLSHSTQMKPVPTVSAVVKEIVPSSGDSEGGTRVAILGSNFIDSPATRVRFDNIDVMPMFHGPGTLVCTAPQHSPGTISVKVCNSPKKWSESTADFTYLQQVHLQSDQQSFPISTNHPGNDYDTMGDHWDGGYDGGNTSNDSDFGNIMGMHGTSFTTLHYASCNGDTHLVEKLLQEQRISVNSLDKYGNTALYWAASEGHQEVVKLLLKFQADANLSNFDGISPILISVVSEHNEIIRILGEIVNINNQTVDGESILHLASCFNNISTVNYILSRGSFINIQDNEGETPLFYAIRESNIDVVELLLSRGALVNIMNEDGESPLYLATLSQNYDIVNLLLRYGANVNCFDSEQITPLHISVLNNSIQITKILIECGANVNAQDFEGNSPLHFAIITSNNSIISLLVDSGSFIHMENKWGSSPFKLASKNNFTSETTPSCAQQMIKIQPIFSINQTTCK